MFENRDLQFACDGPPCLPFHSLKTSRDMNPEREVRQVMSPTTRSGLGEGGLAEGVPTYGGVDSGGARGQLLHGGPPMNRAMAEGCGFPNGVGSQGIVNDQLPHAPEGRPRTTGSASRDQRRGSDALPPRAAEMIGAATSGLDTLADVGASLPTGSGANDNTGPGANDESRPGTDVRRFQGETLGLRRRSTTQQVVEPEQHNIATPPSHPTTSRQEPSHLQLPGRQASQHPSLQQGAVQLPHGNLVPQHEPQPSSSTAPQESSMAPARPARGDQGPQLAQRTALVTALQARAARMVAGENVDERGVLVTEESGEAVEYAGDQTFWFTRFKGMIQRGLEPMFGLVKPSASPTSWYSQSPTWSITTPVFPGPEPQLPPTTREQQPRPLPAPAPEPRGDQSSTGSIQPEVVQEEVRRAVQQAMQQRDNKLSDLQQENAELKQLLMAMLDANAGPRRAQEDSSRVAGRASGNEARPTVEPGQAARPYLPGQGEPELSAGQVATGPRAPPGLPVPDRRRAREEQGECEGQVMAGLARSTTPVTTAEGGSREDAAGKPSDGAGADPGGQVHGDGRREPAQGDTSPSTPLGLLAQGIQQLQQLQLRKDGQDPELLKGSIELPKLPEPYQDTSAVAFLEWVYEAGQAVGSITDRASTWWEANLDLAMTAYHKFQAETPLKRLTIQAGEDSKVDDEKWSRLEKRVMTLLLAAMSSSIKAEITMLRIHRVKDCLFKLYTIFAPGGASERASLIKQLEHIPPHTSVVETIAALRRWKKLMGRAAEMGVSLPDGSVLLMALEGATKQITEGNKDISFKLNMAKNELGLPHKPTLSSVLVYADHIAAELQQVIPFNKDQAAKLKAATIDPGSPGSTAASPSGKGQGQKQPCKFWLTDEGCRRGAACKYGHVFPNEGGQEGPVLDVRGDHSSPIRLPNEVWWKEGQEGWRREWIQGWSNIVRYTNNSSPGRSPEQPPALNSYLNIHGFGNKRDLGTPYSAGSGLNHIYHLTDLNRGDWPPTTTSIQWIVVGCVNDSISGLFVQWGSQGVGGTVPGEDQTIGADAGADRRSGDGPGAFVEVAGFRAAPGHGLAGQAGHLMPTVPRARWKRRGRPSVFEYSWPMVVQYIYGKIREERCCRRKRVAARSSRWAALWNP